MAYKKRRNSPGPGVTFDNLGYSSGSKCSLVSGLFSSLYVTGQCIWRSWSESSSVQWRRRRFNGWAWRRRWWIHNHRRGTMWTRGWWRGWDFLAAYSGPGWGRWGTGPGDGFIRTVASATWATARAKKKV